MTCFFYGVILLVSLILGDLYSISWSLNYGGFCEEKSTFNRNLNVKQGLRYLAVFKSESGYIKMTTVCLTM